MESYDSVSETFEAFGQTTNHEVYETDKGEESFE